MIQRKAFTLIELLIVVAIIAILAAIAVPNFLEAQTRAKVSRVKADIRSVVTAIEAYVIDWNNYPPNLPMISNFRFGENYFAVTTPTAYMTSIPNDPFRLTLPSESADPNKNANGRTTFEYFRYGAMSSVPPPAPPFNGSEGYSLRSMGPDKDLDLVGSSLDPGENQSLINGVYDATNGTISNGDIIRFGGAVNTVPGTSVILPF
jgi:prepilin-type N-terminal cleavage/methylation domain-containing protein